MWLPKLLGDLFVMVCVGAAGGGRRGWECVLFLDILPTLKGNTGFSGAGLWSWERVARATWYT